MAKVKGLKGSVGQLIIVSCRVSEVGVNDIGLRLSKDRTMATTQKQPTFCDLNAYHGLAENILPRARALEGSTAA